MQTAGLIREIFNLTVWLVISSCITALTSVLPNLVNTKLQWWAMTQPPKMLIQIFDQLLNSPTPQRNYYEQYFELLVNAK